MRAGLRAGFFVVGAFALAVLLPATTAGAATGVGRVTVSNPTPTRTSSINVTSTGWRPGSVVTITLSTTHGLLGRATADASGAIRTAISIPSEAPVGFGVLSVNGLTPGGVPQEIVTALSVGSLGHTPAPPRPWLAVSLLMAIATLCLLASVRVVAPDGRLTVAQG